MAENYYTVGEIVNTHGLRGEVRVWPRTDFPETRFAQGSLLYLEDIPDKQYLPLEVVNGRKHKNVYIIKFKQFNHISEVEPLKGKKLKIKQDQLLVLEENEYYYHEIIGCEVYEESGEKLGVIHEILHPGANDVWVCKRPNGKEILIPYIEDVVLDVDVESKKIRIHLMEGML